MIWGIKHDSPLRPKLRTLGHRCATGGPRSLLWRGLGVFRQRCRDAAGWAGLGPKSRKAHRGRSRAGQEGRRSMLGVEPVRAFAALRFEGLDAVAGFFHRTGHKAADGVLLPAHFLHNLGQRRAVLALQHGEHLRGLAALAGTISLRLRGFLGRLGGLLGRGRLLGRLGLGGRNTARLFRTLGLRGGFLLLGFGTGGGLRLQGGGSFVFARFHGYFSLAVSTASRHQSLWCGTKASGFFGLGDGKAMQRGVVRTGVGDTYR